LKLVTAAIIIKNNRVLLMRRKKGLKLEGYWEFPGGKIENDETPQLCLERELHEELCVKSKAGKIIAESIYKYGHDVIKLIGIETMLIEDNFKLTAHDKAEWVVIGNIINYRLTPADIPIAKKIIELSETV